MGEQKPVDQNSLAQRAYWLIRLRWLAASAVVLGTFVCARLLGLPVREAPLYGLAVLLFLYNAAVLHLLNRFTRAGSRQNRQKTKSVIDFQISADLIILTVLLHVSGGPENPLVFFFIFHMIIASILLSVWESYLQATLAILLFGTLLLLEGAEFIPHHCLAPPTQSAASGNPLMRFVSHCRYEEGGYLVGMFATFAVTVYLVVYMAGYVAVRLRRAEEAQREANRLLREKERIKDEYVAHLTHDIKGHLAAIQSCLGVAATESLTGQAAEFVNRAYRRTRKLTAFVRTLLRLTRLKLDGSQEMEVFSLPEAVREAVEAVRREVEVKSQSFECSLDETAAAVRGSESSFREAVTNLLFNAVKYTPERGTISVRMATQRESAALEIADTGIGIPPEEQTRIFEEFYRASNARRVEHDGDGLGLSLVKRVVELHGGTISFCSEIDRGTTFRILLPLVLSQEAPDSARGQSPSREQSSDVQTAIP